MGYTKVGILIFGVLFVFQSFMDEILVFVSEIVLAVVGVTIVCVMLVGAI